MANKRKRWTPVEDHMVIKEIKKNPQNLKKCFAAVAKKTGRTQGAVSTRWYEYLSKDPNVLCFFTASSKHVSKNRKNGVGKKSTYSIWRKFLSILKLVK